MSELGFTPPATPDKMPTLEAGTNTIDIELVGDEAYRAHQAWADRYLERGDEPYPLSRGLEGESSYVSHLPELPLLNADGEPTGEAQSFIDVIDQLIAERKQSNDQYVPPVILDIGPGNYQALLDAREKWGEDVVLVGLGPDNLMDFSSSKNSNKAEQIESTRDRVEAAGIIHIDASVTAAKRSIPEDLRPDVILANQSLQYINVPLWETIREQIYPTLREGGYMFLAFAPPNISLGYSVFAEEPEHFAHADVHRALNQRYQHDLGRLNDFLKSKGFEVAVGQNGTMAMHKVAIDSSYELPGGISTILHPTLEDIKLADKTRGDWTQHWLDTINARVYSAYPVMNIPPPVR